MSDIRIDPVGDYLRAASVVEMTEQDRAAVRERCGEELDAFKRLTFVTELEGGFTETNEAPYTTLSGEEGYVKIVASWGSEDESGVADEAYVYVRSKDEPKGSEHEIMGITRNGVTIAQPDKDPVEPRSRREANMLLNRLAEVRRKVAAQKQYIC